MYEQPVISTEHDKTQHAETSSERPDKQWLTRTSLQFGDPKCHINPWTLLQSDHLYQGFMQ